MRPRRLPNDKVIRIIELLDEGRLSQLAIGMTVGCSAGAVNAIAQRLRADRPGLTLEAGDLSSLDQGALAQTRQRVCEDTEWLHQQLGYVVAPFHRAISGALEDQGDILVAVARGHGKSTIVRTRLVQEICRSAEAVRRRALGEPYPPSWKPNIAIGYCSAYDPIAQGHVDVVRRILERGSFELLWPGLRGSPWADGGAFTIGIRDQEVRETTLFGAGVRSGTWTSQHFDLVVFDDLEVEDNASSYHSVARLNQYLAMKFEGTLMAATRRWWVGTPYSQSGPMAERIRRVLDPPAEGDRMRGVVIPAIQDGASTWPEMFPLVDCVRDGVELEGLSTRRERMDRARPGSFLAQYLLDTSELEDRRLNPALARHMDLGRIPPPARVYQAVDMAWALRPRERSDYTAVATGYLHDGDIYLLRVARAKRDPEATRGFLTLEYELGESSGWWHRPEGVWIERTALYADALTTLRHDLSAIPWRAYSPKGRKEARAAPLEHVLSTGRLIVVRGTGDWWTDLREEMEAFPSGPWDDQVDAVIALVTRLLRLVKIGMPSPPLDKYGQVRRPDDPVRTVRRKDNRTLGGYGRIGR